MPDFGLIKHVGGRTKFLGKTFTIRDYLDELNCHYVHYREEDSDNLIAFKLDNAFCVDVDAWNFAVAQGATLLVAYLVDKNRIAWVDGAIVARSPIRLLRADEGAQYRVPGSEVLSAKAPRPGNVPFIPDEDCIDLDVWARG